MSRSFAEYGWTHREAPDGSLCVQWTTLRKPAYPSDAIAIARGLCERGTHLALGTYDWRQGGMRVELRRLHPAEYTVTVQIPRRAEQRSLIRRALTWLSRPRMRLLGGA